jgi:ribosomal-protein-alanine N-acetyltransferase
MTSNLVIEPLRQQDIDSVSALEQAAGDVGWSRSSFEKELTLQMSRFFVLREGSNILGYGGFWKVVDEAQITNLVIAPAVRRRGHGKGLLDHLIAHARQEGCRRITLEVRRLNSTAQMLYLSTGFAIQGRRPKAYSQPEDDAMLMEKIL